MAKTLDWLKTHKQEAALGAGGIVVAVALYVRSRANASSSSSSGTTSPSTTAAGVEPYGGYVADTSGTDLYNGLEGQIQALGAAISALPATSSTGASGLTPSALVPLSDQTVVGGGYSLLGGSGPGGGYGSGVVESGTGAYFAPYATAEASAAGFAAGQADYEPALGVFQPVTSQGQFNALEAEGTTLFSPFSTTPAGQGQGQVAA